MMYLIFDQISNTSRHTRMALSIQHQPGGVIRFCGIFPISRPKWPSRRAVLATQKLPRCASAYWMSDEVSTTTQQISNSFLAKKLERTPMSSGSPRMGVGVLFS
jgi:hypothetical protein